MKEIIIQLITAFTGALGYAVLFQIGKNKLFMASVGGFIAWTCYLICGLFLEGDILRFYISSVIITIYAEYMARRDKSPATVFLVPATIPLIPGGSLYQTFIYALQEEWRLFFEQGLNTILLAVTISCGILSTMTVMRIYQKVRSRLF